MKTICIGVDIGIKGAIAVLWPNNEVNICDMPTLTVKGSKVKTSTDPHSVADYLKKYKDNQYSLHVCMEAVHAFPGQGACSQFSFGKSAGIIEGVLAALNIQYTQVTPQAWKRYVMPGMGKEKEASVVRALQLFPYMQSSLIEGKAKKDGRADALLMAYYLQQTLSFQ